MIYQKTKTALSVSQPSAELEVPPAFLWATCLYQKYFLSKHNKLSLRSAVTNCVVKNVNCLLKSRRNLTSKCKGESSLYWTRGTLTSMGVDSGTSRKITIQRFWFGRTFSPFSSTWTKGNAKRENTRMHFSCQQTQKALRYGRCCEHRLRMQNLKYFWALRHKQTIFLFIIYIPEEPFLVFYKTWSSGQIQFDVSFSICNCMSAHPGNALVALTRYSSTFPSLVCLSCFEQTQKHRGVSWSTFFPYLYRGLNVLVLPGENSQH